MDTAGKGGRAELARAGPGRESITIAAAASPKEPLPSPSSKGSCTPTIRIHSKHSASCLFRRGGPLKPWPFSAIGRFCCRTPRRPSLELAAAQIVAGDAHAAANTLQRALRLKPGYPEAQAMLVAAESPRTGSSGRSRSPRKSRTTCPRRRSATSSRATSWLRPGSTHRPWLCTKRPTLCARAGSMAVKIHSRMAQGPGSPDPCDARLKQWLSAQPTGRRGPRPLLCRQRCAARQVRARDRAIPAAARPGPERRHSPQQRCLGDEQAEGPFGCTLRRACLRAEAQ